jgi:hypothetical protein
MRLSKRRLNLLWLPADVVAHCAILIDKWALGSIDFRAIRQGFRPGQA